MKVTVSLQAVILRIGSRIGTVMSWGNTE